MKTACLAACAVALLGSLAPAAATEGGGNAYAIGVETNFSGMMLPEGSHLLVYYQHYAADRARGNDGSDNRRFADFGLRADVVALRLSHVWRGVRLAGASLESRIVLPLPSLALDLAIARPPPQPALDRGGATRGPGDLTVAPLLLGWHGATLHHIAGLELILPSGHYNRDRPLNVGRNAWQLAALYGVTWLPGRWEASARLRHAINGRNDATDYRSGNELSLEFSGGYRFAPGWSAGINGYVYRQTSDDRQAGAAVNGDGNRGAVEALGPYLAWSPAPGLGLVAKLQVESGAHNRAEGRRFWLQGRYAF
ncbi:SphA family protein [Azonexus fungiphilus]|uniref:SphA family protein n=1 Tax=Azonexus fungiphilus TaxID=146940 RepID=UPI001C2CC572|nr:transporter [Azonexus fungiphilus]